jgi:catechol-2,3-dioxygenase
VGRVELQAALLVDMAVEDQVADQVYEMDLYYRELGDQLDQDTWREMDAYEAATGMKFVSEGHYHQHIAYLEWRG